MNLHDINTIKTVLDSVIVKNKLKSIMPSRDKAWAKETNSVVNKFRTSASDCSEEEIKADYIVSGDNLLLSIKHFRGVQIIDAASFIKKIAE